MPWAMGMDWISSYADRRSRASGGLPVGLYVLNIGDALMTTLIMTTIIGAWTHKKENSYVSSR